MIRDVASGKTCHISKPKEQKLQKRIEELEAELETLKAAGK
jgi:hypothetical protein